VLDTAVSPLRRFRAVLNYPFQEVSVKLSASITVEAVEELGLSEGSQVTTIIKASDVMVAID
jgi:molybdopterin-binding protein